MHWILIVLINSGIVSEGLHTYDFDSSEGCNTAGKAIVKLYDTTDDSGNLVEHNATYVCVVK